MMKSSCGKMPAEPIWRTASPNGEGNLICSGPHSFTAAFLRMMLTATVLSTQREGERVAHHRADGAAFERGAHHPGEQYRGDHRDRIRQAEGHVTGQPEQRPDHQELALAEIERAGRDECDVIALGDEGVDAANRQAADQRLPQFCEKQTHLGTPPARRIAWLATLPQTEGRTTEVDPGTGFSAPAASLFDLPVSGGGNPRYVIRRRAQACRRARPPGSPVSRPRDSWLAD